MQNKQIKSPTKTFIGGLVIGTLAGSLMTYIVLANILLAHL